MEATMSAGGQLCEEGLKYTLAQKQRPVRLNAAIGL
jgi:hypothetical protein